MKTSIRFFNDREVRAVWDEENSKWWFSAVDIVAAITESEDARNYWYVLKNRLKKGNSKLLTVCKGLKMVAPDGKLRLTDCFLQNDITELVKAIPSKNSNAFLDWFTHSDNTIDGKSKKKAYTFWDSNLIGKTEIGSIKALQKNDYLQAMIVSHTDSSKIRALLKQALTDKINDREIFMKGIDYSYYYEENN